MNFGSCLCCNKTIKYEKINVCKECEDNYIKQILDYGYKSGLKVTVEDLHKELGIPIKVLKFFEAIGFLAQIRENQTIEVKQGEITEQDETKKKIAILNEMREMVQKDNEIKKTIIKEETDVKIRPSNIMHTYKKH